MNGTWFGLITVARYIALSLISRYHCLDPTNRDISGLHCSDGILCVCKPTCVTSGLILSCSVLTVYELCSLLPCFHSSFQVELPVTNPHIGYCWIVHVHVHMFYICVRGTVPLRGGAKKLSQKQELDFLIGIILACPNSYVKCYHFIMYYSVFFIICALILIYWIKDCNFTWNWCSWN